MDEWCKFKEVLFPTFSMQVIICIQEVDSTSLTLGRTILASEGGQVAIQLVSQQYLTHTNIH
jgi:hypothetical protein